MSLALLFPGQGTQHAAMLPWLEAEPASRPALAALAQRLGGDWRAKLADDAWATGNAVAQTLLAGVSIAAWHGLADRLPAPAVVAGYSVGELAAFCAAGVFDAPTALALAGERAAAMDAGAAGVAGALVAVRGATAGALAAVCRSGEVHVAIRLSADQAVLGGERAALAAAQAELARAGVHLTPLAVGVASHTPLMAGASQAFARAIEAVPFGVPHAALVCNGSSAVERQPRALKRAFALQLAHTVHWDRCMEAVAERRVGCVLEVGPGTTLSKLWRERYPQTPARSLDEFRSPAAAAQWVQQAMARSR